MENAVVKLSDYKEKSGRKRSTLNRGKSGSVFSRNGKLWVDFRYLGERVREPMGLDDTPANRKLIRAQLDYMHAEMKVGAFEFAKRFPDSKKKLHFNSLEGKAEARRDPASYTFGRYVEEWWQEMQLGMTENKQRDYKSIIEYHLLPYFKDTVFGDFNKLLMKKFLAHLRLK